MPTPAQRRVYLKFRTLTDKKKQLSYEQRYHLHLEDINGPPMTEAYKNLLKEIGKLMSMISKILKRDRIALKAEYNNPNSVYMITLTLDLKRKRFKDKTFDQLAEIGDKRIKALVKNKELRTASVITYVYALEHHKSGAPHWHLSLQTERPINPKEVFRYWLGNFGNVQWSETITRDVTHTFTYITKETVVKRIVCDDKSAEILTQICPSEDFGTSEFSEA